MIDLNKRSLTGVFGFVVTISLCVLVPAWTFDYWQPWVLLSVLFACFLGITLYLMKNDQGLFGAASPCWTQRGDPEKPEIGQFFGP